MVSCIWDDEVDGNHPIMRVNSFIYILEKNITIHFTIKLKYARAMSFLMCRITFIKLSSFCPCFSKLYCQHLKRQILSNASKSHYLSIPPSLVYFHFSQINSLNLCMPWSLTPSFSPLSLSYSTAGMLSLLLFLTWQTCYVKAFTSKPLHLLSLFLNELLNFWVHFFLVVPWFTWWVLSVSA